jgi:hypothetical protein
MLSGSGGYAPGDIKEERSEEISEAEFEVLRKAIERTGFWDLLPKDEVIGLDGSQLVIESIREGKHVVFVRWTPEHQSNERRLAELVSFYTEAFQNAGFWKPIEN